MQVILQELKLLFAEGMDPMWITKSCRQLENVITIYHHDTASLLELFQLLNGQQQQQVTSSPSTPTKNGILKPNTNNGKTTSPNSPAPSTSISSLLFSALPSLYRKQRSPSIPTTPNGDNNDHNPGSNNNDDNVSVQSWETTSEVSDLSDSSVDRITKLTQQQAKRDEYLSPDLIYFLLALRAKHDKLAKHFVKEYKKIKKWCPKKIFIYCTFSMVAMVPKS